jgi:hypothetical protein
MLLIKNIAQNKLTNKPAPFGELNIEEGGLKMSKCKSCNNEANELLLLALKALNDIPNKQLNYDDCKNSYELCSKIETFFKRCKE